MRATVMYGAGDVRIETVPDARLIEPTDALVGSAVQITRNSIETGRGPSDWFTGAVYIDTIGAPRSTTRATRRPGAST